jgi:hypothetical protein
MENTKDEIRDVDGTDIQCQCYNSNYTGPLDQKVARPLEAKIITPIEVMELMRSIEKRLATVEEYVLLKENKGGIKKNEP